MASVSEAQRDFNLLRHIARYCDDAIDAARQAGSEAVFVESRLYQHAVAMCVLEMGNCPSTCLRISFVPMRRCHGAPFAG